VTGWRFAAPARVLAAATVLLLPLALALSCVSPGPSAPPDAPAAAASEVAPEPAPRPAPSAPEPQSELVTPEPPLPLADRAEPGAGAPGPAEAPPRWPAAVGDGRVLIRVGLASDLGSFELPCCEAEVTLAVDGGPVRFPAPFTIEPAAGSVEAPAYRVQVAALRDEIQARTLARSLATRTSWPAEAGFDAATGLYRVRAGSFRERAEADAAQWRLAELGFGSAWVIEEGGILHEPALRVRVDGRSFRVLGRWLALHPAGPGDGLSVAATGRSGRYRGRLLVFLNDRGSLNLVNELPLEDYLRGVVPRELGPELYPRLEALKAQAVAARTYALRHLGEFADEGFDLCAEPRCQVYGGLAAEHPLSDRAVAETAGEVLLHGEELVEALYSATCGGHTEDSRIVFPWLDAAYLRGVPCPEAPASHLAGTLPRGTPFPAGLTHRLVPPRTHAGPTALQERLETLAKAAGLPPTGDRLRSLERSEVRRYVRSAFDLALDPGLLVETGAEREARAAPALPAVLREDVRGQVTAEESEWLLLGLARVLGLLQEAGARFRSIEGGALTVALRGDPAGGGGAVERVEIASGLATFAEGADGLEAADLALLPGDPLTLYRWRDGLVAVAREGTAAVPAPDVHPRRASRMRTWTRFRSDSRLAALVGERYPGLGFRGLEVVARGVSGRVGTLRLVGEAGRSELVEGLAVRWTLDLPDTRFEARRVAEPGREPGWQFTGGGWGHGVGMCQIGAYTLAGRGLDYREILEHYYTGVRLGRVVVR
jgi:stage II sporulation protein D